MTKHVQLETVHAVDQALALYDHLVDNRQWGHLGLVVDSSFALVTPDGRFEGPSGVRRYEEQAGEHLPAHHVINTQVDTTDNGGLFRAWSRYLLVTWEYQARVGDYLDLLHVQAGSAKLVSREIIRRGAGGLPNAAHATIERWQQVGA